MKLKLPLLLAVSLFCVGSLQAQVATAPLDPSLKVRMPQASALRYIKGDNQSDDKRTSTVTIVNENGSGSFADNTISWTNKGTGFLLIAKTEGVNIEAHSNNSSATIDWNGTSGCTYVDDITTCGSLGTSSQTLSETQFNFSLQKGSVTYGGLYRTREVGSWKETAFGGGVNYQWNRIFFLSAGVEQVSDPSSSIYQNILYGVGLLTGKPEETQMRLEFSVEESSGFTLTQLAAEVKMGKLLISYINESREVNSWSGRDSTILGVGLIPQNGWIFSARAHTDEYNKNSSSSNQNGGVFSASAGYNF